MKTKTDLSPYIVNVQGKDFVTFPGLLAEAHAQGLKSMSTEWINSDLSNPVMKATVILEQEGKEKVFTGYGDANTNNVAKKVAGALLRMSETRSLARALRFACNIDMTAIEELDADNEGSSKPVKSEAPKGSFSFGGTKAASTEVVVPPSGKVDVTVTTSSDGKGNVETVVAPRPEPILPSSAGQKSNGESVSTKFVKPSGVLPTAKFGRPKTEPKFP